MQNKIESEKHMENEATKTEERCDSERKVCAVHVPEYSPFNDKTYPFREGRLQASHPFSWASIDKKPKGDHGIVELRDFKTRRYHILHTGGFVRLCTRRGRAYWLAQNMCGHRTPDWKIHFTTSLTDIPKAWDILVALFMERSGGVGLKACIAHLGSHMHGEKKGTVDASRWKSGQHGRELTMYIYRYDKRYENGGPCGEEEGGAFYLGPEFNRTSEYWWDWVLEAERRFKSHGIRRGSGAQRGFAVGDLPLPGCAYASLRNEAYVIDPSAARSASRRGIALPLPVYPPNECGWNAAVHDPPLLLRKLNPKANPSFAS